MSIRIQLDGQRPFYTNLDIISGTVILFIDRDEPLTGITVKLECESKSRLSAPAVDRRRQDIEYELHKLLYRTVSVFPTPQLIQAAAGMRSATYILPSGEHQFPFQFKFPFNNACALSNSILLTAQDAPRHVKKTLPPTLTDCPGAASIRYFVKATAQRSGLFKENYRQEVSIRFLPTEPPRAPPNRRESYARRQHQFSTALQEPFSPGNNFHRQSGPPPRISIDARLPDPPILTVEQPIPLRILVKKLNQTSELVFLKALHITLIGFTKINARGLERIEQHSWILAGSAGLLVPIGDSNTPVEKDVELNNWLWVNNVIPNASTVLPTFETCNLSRYYELRIDVSLAWGVPGNVKPELSVQSLRMPVDVYSGMKAPPQLLADMGISSDNGTNQHSSATSFQQAPGQATGGSSITSPVNQSQPHQTFSQYQPSAPHDPDGPIDDPPPSYEDAIADGISPADGPRREFNQTRDLETEGTPPVGRRLDFMEYIGRK